MQVTQVYKKATCCNGNCRQGRTCPHAEEAATFSANLGAAFVSCLFLTSPLLLWAYLGA